MILVRLHVHVDLDVGAADGDLLGAAQQGDTGLPRHCSGHGVVEAAERPVLRHGSSELGEFVDGVDAVLAQYLRPHSRRHQRDVAVGGQLRAAVGPPRTRSAFADL